MANSTYAYAGSKYAGLNATGKWISAPSLVNPKTLTFYGCASGTTSNFTIKVQVSTNGSTWTDKATYSANGANTGTIKSTYQQYSVSLNLTGTYYIRWYMSARTGGSLYFDEVKVTN